MTSARYVVVGAGLMGAATAWQLAERGEEVVVVERDVPAGPHGSSHGSARIFRYAYADPFYAELVVRSEPWWARLERGSGRRLIDRVGGVDHGRGREPERQARVLEAAGVAHELLGPARARSRWPQLTVATPVLYQPGAGVLDAGAAVEAMLELAVAGGAVLRTAWPVRGIARSGAGFTVSGPGGETLGAGHVVVAAGGHLPDLLRELPLPPTFLAGLPRLSVWQESAFHFPYRDPGQRWPTTIREDGGRPVYSLPGGRDAGFRGQKVAEYHGGRVLRSAAAQDGVIDPAHRARVVAHVRDHLPGLVPEPYAETTCLFTSTPDEEFVLDSAGGITVVSPCSGHGGKFAPLLGAMAADLAAGTTEATGAAGVPARFRPGAAALRRRG